MESVFVRQTHLIDHFFKPQGNKEYATEFSELVIKQRIQINPQTFEQFGIKHPNLQRFFQSDVESVWGIYKLNNQILKRRKS
jgi:hypothetical protein